MTEYTPEQQLAAYWEKVDKSGGADACWIWIGSKNSAGYGLCSVHGKVMPAHRWSWILVHGAIPDDRRIGHWCENKLCVNPDHLYLQSLRRQSQSSRRLEAPLHLHTQEHVERFWSRIDKSGGELGCWLWTGTTNNKGYGQTTFDGSSQLAHRVAWKLTHGEIPERLGVLHRCDTPRCCNPAHLFLGTQKDNVRDMVAKKRNATKLSGAKVILLRRLYERGVPVHTLVEKFHISRHTVWNILSRRTWK